MASNKPSTRLRELHGSGYEIKKGQPDIRGWDVRDDNRHKYGKVQELIFDIRANKVRYLVVNIFDTKELDLEKRTVLVPIGLAVLDGEDDDVILPSVTPFQLRALPRYDKDKLGAKAERDISYVFGRSSGSEGTTNTVVEDDADVDTSFYEHDHFNEDNMQRNRVRSTPDRLSEQDRISRTNRVSDADRISHTDHVSDADRISERDRIENTDRITDTDRERRSEGQVYYKKGEELRPLNPAADRIDDTHTSDHTLVNRNETEEEAIRRVRQGEETKDGTIHHETDEEYIRRARKNLDR